MLQLLLSVLLLAGSARYAGEVGARRYDALPDERARADYETLTSRVVDWLIIFNAAAAAVNAVLAGLFGSVVGVGISVGAVALSLVAWRVRKSARSNVRAGFDRRNLEALHPRERSARRDRRQKQLAVIALTGYLTAQVSDVVAGQTGPSWLTGVALFGMLVAAGSALGLVASMAWRFGDEEPA